MKEERVKWKANDSLYEIFVRLYPKFKNRWRVFGWWARGVVDERTQRGDFKKRKP